ncbi:hypothetical protein C8R48DRAFT_591645, partial [Suillus tomentosus]
EVTKVFNRCSVERAFFGFSIESMFLEMEENFSDMFLMGCKVLGIDEVVVQIYDNTYIQHISKHTIDKALECGQSVSETFWHHQPFIGAIMFLPFVHGCNSSLPFISFCYPDEVISGLEVDFGIDFSAARRISVFLGNLVESMEIHTEAKGAILFLDKQDRSSVRRG